MSVLVADLVRAGLVERETDPDDRRVVRVRATPQAERLMQAGRRRRTDWLARRLADLPPEDLAALDRAAELIERVLAPHHPTPITHHPVTAPTRRRP
jgi:DNA-binding MarR family transcriptional regulator